jgi:hypothetical protein
LYDAPGRLADSAAGRATHLLRREMRVLKLDEAFSGSRSVDDGMTEYQRGMNMPADVRIDLPAGAAGATAPEMQQLPGAIQGTRQAMVASHR